MTDGVVAVAALQKIAIAAAVNIVRVIRYVHITLSLLCGEQKRQNPRVKYWEIIAGNLTKAGWSWGYVSAIGSNRRTIWIVDAHRDEGKRFVVREDEKLTEFVELESATRACGE